MNQPPAGWGPQWTSPQAPRRPTSNWLIAAVGCGGLMTVAGLAVVLAIIGAVTSPPASGPARVAAPREEVIVGQNAYVWALGGGNQIPVYASVEDLRVGDDRSPAGTLARQRRKIVLCGARVRRRGGDLAYPEIEVLEGPWKQFRGFVDGEFLHEHQKPGIASSPYPEGYR